MNYPSTVAELTETLTQGRYLADRGLATAVFVAMSLQRPFSWRERWAWARLRSPRCSRRCTGAR